MGTAMNKQFLRAVVIESSEIDRAALSKLLGQLFFEVYSFENGAEALEALNGDLEDVDLIVCAEKLPILDGFSLLTLLKSDHRFDRTRFVLTTNVLDELTEAKGRHLGVDGLIPKPVGVEALKARVSVFFWSKTP